MKNLLEKFKICRCNQQENQLCSQLLIESPRSFLIISHIFDVIWLRRLFCKYLKSFYRNRIFNSHKTSLINKLQQFYVDRTEDGKLVTYLKLENFMLKIFREKLFSFAEISKIQTSNSLTNFLVNSTPSSFSVFSARCANLKPTFSTSSATHKSWWLSSDSPLFAQEFINLLTLFDFRFTTLTCLLLLSVRALSTFKHRFGTSHHTFASFIVDSQLFFGLKSCKVAKWLMNFSAFRLWTSLRCGSSRRRCLA